MDKHELRCEAIDFEKAHGTESFIKACLSAISFVVVEKGICTEDELRISLMREMNRYNDGILVVEPFV